MVRESPRCPARHKEIREASFPDFAFFILKHTSGETTCVRGFRAPSRMFRGFSQFVSQLSPHRSKGCSGHVC